jgi:hypothetical protein
MDNFSQSGCIMRCARFIILRKTRVFKVGEAGFVYVAYKSVCKIVFFAYGKIEKVVL